MVLPAPSARSSGRKTELSSRRVLPLSAPRDPTSPPAFPRPPPADAPFPTWGVFLLTDSSGTSPNTDTGAGTGMHLLKGKTSDPLYPVPPVTPFHGIWRDCLHAILHMHKQFSLSFLSSHIQGQLPNLLLQAQSLPSQPWVLLPVFIVGYGGPCSPTLARVQGASPPPPTDPKMSE